MIPWSLLQVQVGRLTPYLSMAYDIVTRGLESLGGCIDRHPARPDIHLKGPPMAKPNYAFDKRQRDLAKKKKKEEKRLRKQKPLEDPPKPSED